MTVESGALVVRFRSNPEDWINRRVVERSAPSQFSCNPRNRMAIGSPWYKIQLLTTEPSRSASCRQPKMTKSEARSERRSNRRVVAQVPVRVRKPSDSSPTSALTRDVSTNGIFLYTQTALTEGSDVELVLILPPEMTSGEKSWVCCHARVVRVEHGAGGDFGVAAEIKRMDVLPELPALS